MAWGVEKKACGCCTFAQGVRPLFGATVTAAGTILPPPSEEFKSTPRAAMRGNVWAAPWQHRRTMGNRSAWVTVEGQPGRSTQIVRKDVDLKRQLTSRLETRTKESNMHVSIMVENQ